MQQAVSPNGKLRHQRNTSAKDPLYMDSGPPFGQKSTRTQPEWFLRLLWKQSIKAQFEGLAITKFFSGQFSEETTMPDHYHMLLWLATEPLAKGWHPCHLPVPI